MDKKIKIGDVEYNIRMTLGVFEHLKTITGQDGISFIQTANTDIVKGTHALLLAGCMCYAEKHGTEKPDGDVLLKSVKDDAAIENFTELINIYAEFMNPGEVNQVSQTASQSPGHQFKNSPMDA